MGSLFNLKEKWALGALKRMPDATRQRKGVKFADAQSIAIVYLDKDDVRYQQIKQYIQWLKGEFGIKHIKAFAYFGRDEKLAPAYLAHKLETDYFAKSDLSWTLKPKGNVQSWAQEAPDILIDMTVDKCLPIAHLVKMSAAAMKVGIAGSYNQAMHDLSIAVQNTADLQEFITQTRYYLSKLELV